VRLYLTGRDPTAKLASGGNRMTAGDAYKACFEAAAEDAAAARRVFLLQSRPEESGCAWMAAPVAEDLDEEQEGAMADLLDKVDKARAGRRGQQPATESEDEQQEEGEASE
jgi:hypothetical protein